MNKYLAILIAVVFSLVITSGVMAADILQPNPLGKPTGPSVPTVNPLQKQGDLTVKIGQCPKVVKPGQQLGSSFTVEGQSTFSSPLKDIAVDIILTSKATYPSPVPYAVYSPNYSDGVLLLGGREFISFSGPGSVAVKLNGTNTIPANTPPGKYYLGSVIDAGNKTAESNEQNNVAFCEVSVQTMAQPNVKIKVQWGSSNVGSTQYGEKLTAYIAVTNTSAVDCYPPSGAKFVVGAYYKTLGLVKATSVGLFPSVIKAGETKNFIQQSLDDAHQALIYNGYVDFYVSSQAPGQPDLSAAVRPACNGEINLNDNNAHSVKKVITNP